MLLIQESGKNKIAWLGNGIMNDMGEEESSGRGNEI